MLFHRRLLLDGSSCGNDYDAMTSRILLLSSYYRNSYLISVLVLDCYRIQLYGTRLLHIHVINAAARGLLRLVLRIAHKLVVVAHSK